MFTLINSIKEKYTKEPLLSVSLTIVFLIALFFRVFDYYNRVYIYADNALFVQAAYYGFKNGVIPQIGPFAQAPFFTGPWWLWILMTFFILPLGSLTPWYAMTGISLLFILLLYKTGKELYGKWFGALAALLGSISTAAIDNSFTTWNAGIDPMLGLLSLYCFIKYVKSKKPLFLFFLTFFVSLATTIHFETFLLSGLIVTALIIGRPKLKEFIYPFIGGLIPILPFLYFDLRFNWFWTIRVYEYITIGQARIYVPNRWLTYAFTYWPDAWSFIIGGSDIVSYILCILVVIVSAVSIFQFKKYKLYFYVLCAFLISVTMLRYYRGERFFYFTNYAHGFVLILTTFVIWRLYQFKKTISLILLSIVAVATINRSIYNFDPRVATEPEIRTFMEEIYNEYPGETFDIYECPFSGSIISTPVSYLMYYSGKNTLNGLKIGVCNAGDVLTWSIITDKDITSKHGFKQKSTPAVYHEMTEWWIKEPPTNESLYD